jgi:hypothetical protein
MPARRRPQTRSVFVNCPFDQDYKDLFNALVFAVHDCGFYVRCALEIETGALRFQTICDLIRACRYGIHDLSRTQLDPESGLPRFNMPLELGLFLGAREFGPARTSQKVSLVLDTERFRYQQFCSDLAGVDIVAHANQPRGIVHAVRNWLRANPAGRSRQAEPEILPDGDVIFERYEQFLTALPDICKDRRLGRDHRSLQFPDYVDLVEGWLLENNWRPTGRQV